MFRRNNRHRPIAIRVNEELIENEEQNIKPGPSVVIDDHTCEDPSKDPFVGTVREENQENCCCATMAFDINYSKENLTSFGKHILYIKDNYGKAIFRSHGNAAGSNTIFSKEIEYKSKLLDSVYTDGNRVVWCFTECSVCFDYRFVRRPPCCKSTICYQCWQTYCKMQSQSISATLTGSYNLSCFSCQQFVPYRQATSSLEEDQLEMIRPPGVTTQKRSQCPHCLSSPPVIVTDSKKNVAKLEEKLRRKKGGVPINCSQCSKRYCSLCGGDEHPKFSCHQLVSDDAVKAWAKSKDGSDPSRVSLSLLYSFYFYCFFLLLVECLSLSSMLVVGFP